MSFIVKNKDIKLLVSFHQVKDDEFMILATSLRQFYARKEITNSIIHEKFLDSDTRIKIPLAKIIKIIKEDQPVDSEVSIQESGLNLVLKYSISIKNIKDVFMLDFALNLITSPSEIGELFFCGLLKTVIEQKLTKSEDKIDIKLPETPFEANFAINNGNVADLCELIGGNIECKKNDSNKELPGSSSESENALKVRSKRPFFGKREFKFEKLDDSQEMELSEAASVDLPVKNTTKNSKMKRNNKKF